MNKQIQIEINHICNDINKRIKQMTYNEETCIREFIEGCRKAEDDFLTFDEDEIEYIASLLNVNSTCIYDVLLDNEVCFTGMEEYDEDDEAFWKEQDRADDYNDERRLGI
jgi:hypothetical protein